MHRWEVSTWKDGPQQWPLEKYKLKPQGLIVTHRMTIIKSAK
jgi:hypothetical protein